jgi:CSLREA domain-containing protein
MTRQPFLLALRLWIAAGLLVSLFFSPAPVVRAATITVSQFADDDASNSNGSCSLREAVEAANTDAAVDGCPAGSGADTVVLPAGTYPLSLTTGLVVTGDTLTIQSSGGAATIDASGLGDRVLQVQAGATVTLQGLTLTGGSLGNNGAGILNAGTLTLDNVTLTGNSATGGGFGGGLANFSGTATINAGTISANNAAQGGGLAVIGGTVSVNRSLITGNDATTLGGGAYVGGGATLDLTNVTLRSSSAVDGAGVYSDGILNVIQSTFSENVASGNGGGVYNNVVVQLRNSVIAGNSAAGGPDCFGVVGAPSNNFISTTSGCTLFGGGTVLTGASPLSAFNGQVYPLAVPSAAIDAATPADCVSPDQIGNARPLDGDGDGSAVCDLGAFESPTIIPTATPTPTVTPTLPPGVTPSNTPTPTATLVPPATATPIPGNPPQPRPTPVGVQPVGKGGGTFRCGGWRVIIPVNVVPDGGGIHCGDFNPDVAPGSPAGFRLLRHTINVNIYDDNGSWITQFNTPLTFCYPYATADLNAATGNIDRFAVQTAPIAGAWTALITDVNTAAREACAKVSHLTLFDLSVKQGAASGAPGTYVVQPGDNLFRIALRFGLTVAALQAANGLTGTFIYVGQVLIIPGQGGSVRNPPPATPGPAGTYVVQPGDNLFRIALRFGTTVAALQAANGLGRSILIYAGQRLIIPGPGRTPTPVASPTPRPGSTTIHVVQPGETLFRIALKFRVTVSALQAANNLRGTLIFPGQRLTIPGAAVTSTPTPAVSGTRTRTSTPTRTPTAPRTYIVVTGDTLFSLAIRFGTTVAKLQAANNLRGTRIYVGQVLVIP